MSYEEPKNYAQAQERLQALLEKIKDENCSIDLLAQYVEEAGQLIEYCKERLAETDFKVTEILEKIGGEE